MKTNLATFPDKREFQAEGYAHSWQEPWIYAVSKWKENFTKELQQLKKNTFSPYVRILIKEILGQ